MVTGKQGNLSCSIVETLEMASPQKKKKKVKLGRRILNRKDEVECGT